MVGSAQRRFKNVFLQHGSILTGAGHERLADYMKKSQDLLRLQEALVSKSIGLDTALGHPADTEILKASLFESFSRAAGGKLTKEEPSPREIEYARISMQERYSSKGWILGHG